MKKALRCVLLVLLLNNSGIGKGYAETIGNLNYSLNRTTLTATVTGHKDGLNAMVSLVIPSSVTYTDYYYVDGQYVPVTRTYSVTTIGENAFRNCYGITGDLTIGNSVTTIGENAFRNCYGFTGDLTIGNSVTTIGEYAFSGCSGFTGDLTIGNSVTTIGNWAFSGCSGFTGDLTIGNSVTTIGENIFRNCSGFTGNLTIGNSVITIGDHAFFGCSGFTGDLSIPNSVTMIDHKAFQGCSGFTGSLSIPNSVTTIGGGAFSGCSGFTGSLTIPNSVTTIDHKAFQGCSGFTGDLIIPNSVTTIGGYAFDNCSGFTGVVFNATNCEDTNSSPFSGCVGSLTIGINVERIPANMFQNCDGFTGSLTIPNSVTTIGEYAFYNCSGFTGSLTIGNSVATIGEKAFYECNGFTGDLEIPSSLTSIGAAAFAYCYNLTSIHFNASNCESMGYDEDEDTYYSVFSNNFSLNEIVIGDNVTSIPAYAFANHYSEHCRLVLGNAVETIGYGAFYNDYYEYYPGLVGELTIPSSVSTIDNAAFYGCRGIEGIRSYAEVPPTIGGAEAFFGVDKNIPVLVPCGTVEDYEEAPCWSDFTNITDAEYFLYVTANPDYLGTAVIMQNADCDNSRCIVKAIPQPGCRFVNWTCNGEEVSQHRNYAFDLEEDMELVANFKTQKRFVHLVSLFWSDPDNWEPTGVPDDTMAVELQSNVVIDTDITVGSVYIKGNYTLTINPNATLTVTERLESAPYASSRIVIEEGGQLVHSNEGVYATVMKVEKTRDENSDNWSLISSPLRNVSYRVENMLANQYDLYYYNEPTQYWNNYKQTDGGFYYLNAGQGYLYANSGNITPVGVQIGEGTWSTTDSPFNTNYYNSISEILFHADELAAAGLGTEPLGALCWYATYTYGYEQNNISIWMANVSDSELTETSHITSNMTLVYTGDMTPTWGWNEFVFNEGSFAWDGTSNVLVCVQKNGGWDYVYWQSHETDFIAMSSAYTYDLEYDMTSQTYSMSTSYTRPNTIFETAGQLGTYEYHSITLSFAGQLQSGTAQVNIPLNYTEGIDHPGYNLVGNPFVHNVISYASENVAEGCYRMNETQDDIIVSEISEAHPLKVAEGFFVRATGENASITFNPQAKAKARQSGSIYLEITENGQLIDRLIIKKDGEPLEKLSLKPQRTKLFANKGNKEMAIVPIEANEQTINFKAAHDGTYTLTVNVDGMDVGYLHLVDKLTGEDTNLLDTSTGSVSGYTFEAKTTDDANRFKLVFSISGDADGDDEMGGK